MTTSTQLKITLTQKPGIAQCRIYTLTVPDETHRQEISVNTASTYEEHEARIQQAISEGWATVVSIDDEEIL